MLVIESAAAGCGIPSCDSLRKNLSKLHNANKADYSDTRTVNLKTLVYDSRTTTFHKFASKYIGIRAFHNAISRSCVLFNVSRRRQR